MGLGAGDETHLQRAIALARHAREEGNHPFGAVLVAASGEPSLEAENTVVTAGDVTGHAELNAVRAASIQLDGALLEGATLYASTEPCAMCSGAAYWAGIARVVYALGADALAAMVDDAAGASRLALGCREVFARGDRDVEVSGPHLTAEATAVHEGFWER
jgi:tRNA(Arg) A34 adenosine deaminase TadA